MEQQPVPQWLRLLGAITLTLTLTWFLFFGGTLGIMAFVFLIIFMVCLKFANIGKS